MRCRELRFQILDAILEPLCFRVGCVRLTGAGRAAPARRHKVKMPACSCPAAFAPGTHLAVDFAHRLALIQSGNVIRTWDAQYSATAQNIYITAKCNGIGSIQRHHGLVDVQRRSGVQTSRDLRQRIAWGDVVSAATDGRCGFRAGV